MDKRLGDEAPVSRPLQAIKEQSSSAAGDEQASVTYNQVTDSPSAISPNITINISAVRDARFDEALDCMLMLILEGEMAHTEKEVCHG